MVRALHAAGMEVLLELEFCTTGEGADGTSPFGLQGMHGLDSAIYYRCEFTCSFPLMPLLTWEQPCLLSGHLLQVRA